MSIVLIQIIILVVLHRQIKYIYVSHKSDIQMK